MSRTFANLMLVVAAICWGSGNVAQQTVLEHIGPFWATSLKSMIATVVILPYCLRVSSSRNSVSRSGFWLGSIVVASFVAATTLMQISYGLTSVTNAGFLINTATVLTPIIAWILLRQKASNNLCLAAMTTLVATLLMGGGRIGSLSSGDLLCLGSAFCFAIWMISLGEFVTRYGRSGQITIMQFVITSLVCALMAFAFESPALASIFSALPELLYIGAISTGCAYLLQAIAQRYTSPSEAAVIVSAEALFGAGTAMAILGETLSTERAIGAGLIIASIVFVQLPTKRKPTRRLNTDLPILTPGE